MCSIQLKMGSNQGFSRLDTLEIKSLIYRQIGHQSAESYFNQLGRFFALKITKSEFDEFCIKTIGRQNIHLHNRLIRSIIKNASVAKSPPSRFTKKGGNFVKFDNGNPKNTQIQPLYADSAFSPSARKCRSRKFRDRPSPLGKPQSLTTTNEEESMSKAQSATELLSLGSRPPVEVASVEEGEEVEQIAASPSVQSRSPVTAPIGVSMNLRNGVTRKSVSNVSMCSSSSFNRETCQNSGELPHTRTLRSRLERRLKMEGLKISMDSVSLLNCGLDAFMRRLIEPCLSLANTRCGNEQVREMNYQYTQQSRRLSYVSMSDFRASMELNPQILGEEWPIHMEKICSRASDE